MSPRLSLGQSPLHRQERVRRQQRSRALPGLTDLFLQEILNLARFVGTYKNNHINKTK
jgi:hypothetical protein